jgi:hypothetical protein
VGKSRLGSKLVSGDSNLYSPKVAKAFMKTDFYTYAFLRKDGTPYYIGKGTRRRCYKPEGRPCQMPSGPSRILILKKNLTEEEAFKHEIYLIALYGRKEDGGILFNHSLGGQGISGCKRPDLANYNRQQKKGRPPCNRKRVEITFENGRVGVYSNATFAAMALGVSPGTITHWVHERVKPSRSVKVRYI